MTQIALVADPDVPVDELTLAIWADALDKQVKEISAAWGVPYTPVVFYKSTDSLPATGVRIANIKMSLDTPGALGFHDVTLGVVYSRELWTGADTTASTISHEDAEEIADPLCDQYKPWNDSDDQALELADRVEDLSYTVTGTVGAVSRDILLSDWLYPSAFDPNGQAPFDKMGKLTAWNGMSPGGYVILRSKATGETTDVFARRRSMPRVVPASPAAHEAIMRRLARPESRLMRRLRAG